MKLSPKMQEALTFYAWAHVYVSVLPGNVYLHQPNTNTIVALITREALTAGSEHHLTADGWHALDVETAHGVALIMNRDRDDALTDAGYWFDMDALHAEALAIEAEHEACEAGFDVDGHADCAGRLPGHRHCRRGHVADCPDPGECELIERLDRNAAERAQIVAESEHAIADSETEAPVVWDGMNHAWVSDEPASSNVVTTQADIGVAVASGHIIVTMTDAIDKSVRVWSIERDSLWSVLRHAPFHLSAEDIMDARKMVNDTEEYGEHNDPYGRIMWAPAVSLAPAGFEPDGPDVWVWKQERTTGIRLALRRSTINPAHREVFVAGQFVGFIGFDGKVWSEVRETSGRCGLPLASHRICRREEGHGGLHSSVPR